MKNLVQYLRNDLKRHKVRIKLPDDKRARMLFLVLITAETDIITDIRDTYPGVSDDQLDIAQKVFFSRRFNVYGVLSDKNGAMVFAFNRALADYDPKIHKIVVKDLDEVLRNPPPEPSLTPVDMSELIEKIEKLDRRTTAFEGHEHLSSITFKYAAPEPRPTSSQVKE